MEHPMSQILIIGYGNPDREDDGAAWHVLQKLADYYNTSVSTYDEIETAVWPAQTPHQLWTLQLTPEMAELIAQYKLVCFVDAHTGYYQEDLRVASIEAAYQLSPFTHHLTPQTCLALVHTLYGQTPQAVAISVRGYRFGYGTELSDQTAALVEQAVNHITTWVSANI